MGKRLDKPASHQGDDECILILASTVIPKWYYVGKMFLLQSFPPSGGLVGM